MTSDEDVIEMAHEALMDEFVELARERVTRGLTAEECQQQRQAVGRRG